MSIAYNLALHSASPAAHQVAFDRGPELRNAFRRNDHVDIDLWRSCYEVSGPYKISASDAKAAISGSSDPDRVKHVLAVEKRSSVLNSLLKSVYPSPALFEQPGFVSALANEQVADSLARTYGPAIDPACLGTLPAAGVGGPLRVWRLLDDSLSDEHVLSELLSYDAWASPYQQKPLAWVLYSRPQLITQLAGENLPMAVLTQLAGSPRLGMLAEEQQRAVVRADSPIGPELADIMLYAWMAASSNPTLKMSVLDDVEVRMLAATREFNPSSAAMNRRQRRPWSVPSLAQAVSDDQFPELVNWAVPARGKVRLGGLDQLMDNPAFSEGEAELVAARLVDELDIRADDTALLAGTIGARVLSKLNARYPDACAGLLEAHQRRYDILRNITTRSHEHLYRQDGNPEATLGASPTPAQVAWLDQKFNDDPEAWSMAYQMVDTLWAEPLGKFADTCIALTL